MKHVLVIRLSALGDVALMAPVLKAYAVANPDVRFTVAGPPMLVPLFAGMPNVEYLGLKKKQSFVKIYKALNAVGADTVVDLHQVNKVGWALLMLRLHHLFDFRFHIYHLRKGRVSRWLVLHHWSHKPRRPQYVRYADVFRRAGLDDVRGKMLDGCLTEGNGLEHRCNKLMKRKRCEMDDVRGEMCDVRGKKIGVAPFAQHEGKIWPLERMETLVRMLSERGYEVVLFGSKVEAPVLEGWAYKYRGVTSVAGRLPFTEELEIIRGLALMVSMDSANMHFASAVGVPVVSIWGATHPDFGFYGYGQDRANALCANLECQPCSAYGNKTCRYGDYRCLRAISPEAVLEKIETFIGEAQ